MTERDNLIWIDLEMTGLSPEADVVIEIATVVTDAQLVTVAEGPVIAVHHPETVLERMDEWNRRQHGGSGLVARIRESHIDTAGAERQTLDFLARHVAAGASPMCGNSICQDRRFLARHMPALEEFFHYRNLDVSTLKELARRWAPQLTTGFSKEGAHLALADVYDSIRELQYYREHLLVAECRLHA
jgi:oligoribonuclease